jgi:glycosyltransferase involved in cell wall biosynthesis
MAKGCGAVRKVLYVSHNHPANRPGGLEVYAAELYRAVREAGEFEPIFVAKVGPPQSADTAHDGTRFSLAGTDPNEYYLYTQTDEFDRVLRTARSKRLYTEDWRSFLHVHEPDLVHFHHADYLGYDMLRETRNTLPHAAIVYTLHDFQPICHHDGQMVRTETYGLCFESSPRRCNQCFPRIPVQTFFLRERFIKSAFELVDMFIAPSEFLRRRYVDWGIPPERIVAEDYGRFPVTPAADPPDAGRRNRIGFLGQLIRYKGVDVLLEAMKNLQRDGTQVQLLLSGANLDRQPVDFQGRVHQLLEETSDSVRFTGRYEQAELPALLSAVDWVVVPSIWWENSPLVIQEAMMHRRPVICSDIGGMAEKIRDGFNGLHFRVGDPYSLADAIRRAVSTPTLWDELRSRITDPHPMDEHVMIISDIYNELLARHAANTAAA